MTHLSSMPSRFLASALLLGVAAPAGSAMQASGPSRIASVEKLVSPYQQLSGYLAHDVDLSAGTLIVGAYSENNVGVDRGRAFVYVFDDAGTPNDFSDDTWPLQAELPDPAQVPFPLADGDQFGVSVAIDGDTAVVGVYGDDHSGFFDAGSAYVYQRVGITWTQLAFLIAPTPATSDQFGRSVAISGDTIVVGAHLDDVPGNVDAGQVFVYVRNDNGTPANLLDDTFPQTQQFSGSAGDRFGFDVAIEGSVLVAGAYLDDEFAVDQGSATVLYRNGAGIWIVSAPKLLHPVPAFNDQFGIAVAVSGERVVVGAWADDSPLGDAGSAHLFERFGNSWGHVQQIVAPDAAAGDLLGRGVAVDADHVFVAAPYDNYVGVTDLGSVYAFDWNGIGLTYHQKFDAFDGTAPEDQLFGYALALDGGFLVSGAHQFGDLSDDAGAAYVYRMTYGMQFSTLCYGYGTGPAVCPCGNDTNPERRQGCKNSNPGGVLGGLLLPLGSDSASADDLHLFAYNLIPSSPALLFSGPASVAAVPLGDGLRCVGGPGIKRHDILIPDSLGRAIWGPGLRTVGGWNASDTRFMQVWYRNTVGGPCGMGTNLSNAVEVTFTP